MQGENFRRETSISDLDILRLRIVGEHKICGGKGIREKSIIDSNGVPRTVARLCKCNRRFDLISRFVLSDIPYYSLINQKIYKKIVVDELSGKDIDLKKELVYPFIKKIRQVIVNPYGLVFLGKHGTGKTFVGQKILYYVLSNGHTAHYIELSSFLNLLRRNFEENLDPLIHEISNVDILMIDEIGNESKRSEFSIGEFKSLLKRRVESNKPTILASNYSYGEFKVAYGKSVESIVEAFSKILNFKKVVDVRRVKGRADLESFFKKIKE